MKEKLTRKSKPNFGCICDSCHYAIAITSLQYGDYSYEHMYKKHCSKCEGDSQYVSKAFILAKNERYIRKNGGCRSKPNLAWWHYNRLHPLPF